MQKTQNEIETDDMTKLANFLHLIKRLNGEDEVSVN
jgi:hypothetical protein